MNKNTLKNTFGLRIRELRKKQNLTQAQLAKNIGCAQSTLADWENNRNSGPTNKFMSNIAKTLKVSIDDLLNSLGENNFKLPYYGEIKTNELLVAKTNCKPVLKDIDKTGSKNTVEKTTIETSKPEKTSIVEAKPTPETEVKTNLNSAEQQTATDKTCYKPVLKNTTTNPNPNKIILDRIPMEIAQQHKLQPQELEYLKNHVKIVDVVTKEGIQLKKSGNNLMGLCPFHEDRKPSLVLTPQKNLWHCFGCGRGGSVIDWVI